MKEKICCIMGNIHLPMDKLESALRRLIDEIDNLYDQGVTTFVSDVELSFGIIAASMVIGKKEEGKNIRLIFALSCKDQDKFWADDQKKAYRSLLAQADEVEYVSNEYSFNCEKRRDYYMIDMSAYCICAQLSSRGSIARTVNYAKQKGLQIINVAK